MKRLGVFLLPVDASRLQVTPPQFGRFPQQIAGTHLYTWVERGTVKVKCLTQEHDTVSLPMARTRNARSRVEPESSALSIRPPHFQYSCMGISLMRSPRYAGGIRKRRLISPCKRIKCFPSTLRRRNLQTQQRQVILDVWFRKSRAGKLHY